MIIQEDYKNLNIIDRSLIEELNLKEAEYISPESEVIVDKVREPHSFNTIMDIVKQDDVACVIFRASRRQLMLIAYDINKDFKKLNNTRFYVRFSDYAYDNIQEIDRYQQSNVLDSESVVKTMISSAFLGFYGDDQTAKKVWDILVVKVNSKKDLRTKREESQRNAIPTPSEKEKYANYLEGAKIALKYRLERYIEQKLPNIKSKQEAIDFFNNDINIKKIKINQKIFILEDKTLDNVHNKFILTYKMKDSTYGQVFSICKIEFIFEGIRLKVDSIKFYSRTYDTVPQKEMD